MKTSVCILGLCTLFGLSQAMSTPAGVPCLSDDDCSMDECCYKKHDDLIVSKKRDATFEGFHMHQQDLTHVKGMCMAYHRQGDYCSIFDKTNGFCSCNTKRGDTCKYVSSQGPNGPPGGVYTCQPLV